MSMSEAEKFMKTNIEALTRDETGGGDNSRYPNRDAKFCTLYVYSKGSVAIRGLEDRCPIKNGSGCNPYSCQEVPY